MSSTDFTTHSVQVIVPLKKENKITSKRYLEIVNDGDYTPLEGNCMFKTDDTTIYVIGGMDYRHMKTASLSGHLFKICFKKNKGRVGFKSAEMLGQSTAKGACRSFGKGDL